MLFPRKLLSYYEERAFAYAVHGITVGDSIIDSSSSSSGDVDWSIIR